MATSTHEKTSDKLNHQRLNVDGMTCGHCAMTVNKTLCKLDGVVSADVNHAAGRADVAYTGELSRDQFRQAISDAGYTLIDEADDTSAADRAKKHARDEFRLLIWSTLITLPVIVIHMGGLLPHAPGATNWATWLVFACATILQPTSAITYYRGAIRSLKNKRADMDVLVSLGVLSGYLYATLATFLPAQFPGHAMEFFEAATLLICFIRLGKWVESKARASAAGAMQSLLELTPQSARRVNADGESEEVSVDVLRPGDHLIVLPGERFPVDGEVLEGQSSANEALLTGESMPVAKSVGDEVIAGAVNQEAKLIVRAKRVGADTAVNEIVRLVEEAQSQRAPIQRIADQISSVFVPAVVVIAAASGLYWGLLTDVGMARVLTHVIGVMVIACPCALGLAVPAAIMIGSAAGLKRGVLVKNGAALEKLGKLDLIAFDKTGTLTIGEPALASTLTTDGVSEEQALQFAGALAASSTHPLSRALLAELESRGLKAASDVRGEQQEEAGRGAKLTQSSGTAWRLGSAAMMSEAGISTDALRDAAAKEAELGASISYLAKDQQVLAAFAFRDPIREEAREVIAALKKQGVLTVLLSGDLNAAAKAVASELGIDDVRAQLKPGEKLDAIKEWQDQGLSVGMVGDGINDAPALAAANVGIAVGGGTDVAQDTGDIVLMQSGIAGLVTALDLSRRTWRGIKQNLFVSLIYNAVGIPLAAGLGTLITPDAVIPASFAALAMVASDFSVAGNSARLAWELKRV